ncbi:MAG: carbonic anhydrase [Gammaproteobacteria bacterium]|mgnify:CR=1 FL=1|jgi:carbonic anhydrase|nr:carbonic anhydrase [Gammaproteobacteria bacterium]MBT3722853.1 carbonic anhydrase [Gammaproteobacteria bacterium]MBT4077586.1 carbonic anhydrase [Gammaproteobacteria bacterium]MBT4194931.1 carbonic anhydrase [Gammaproteobacteria bacterium]MBT4449923.1 carbonic anhydrase [Gammaproteobacteria bacterium]
MIEKLSKGYERFRQGYFQRNRSRLEQLAEKQTPEIAMISCCDSRVDPGILFDVEPGDLFVIRNVANLVPPFETRGDYHGTSAALEFAVTSLQVKQVVVLGHANCGGIRALMDNDSTIESDGFIDSWMNLAATAKKEVLARDDLKTAEQRIDACEKAAISHSLKNLMSYPWINQRVNSGSLELLGCYYDLRSGELISLDEVNAEVMKGR